LAGPHWRRGPPFSGLTAIGRRSGSPAPAARVSSAARRHRRSRISYTPSAARTRALARQHACERRAVARRVMLALWQSTRFAMGARRKPAGGCRAPVTLGGSVLALTSPGAPPAAQRAPWRGRMVLALAGCARLRALAPEREARGCTDHQLDDLGGPAERVRRETPRRGTAAAETATPIEALEIIRRMAVRYGDDQIASVLNRRGYSTGKGKRWNQTRVATARRNHSIAGQKRALPDPDPGR
jgi:hypothetical protein